MGQCGGLERTDFEQCLLWKGMKVDVVVLKELISDSFYCGRVWWYLKELILNSFYLGNMWREVMVVLKELDFEQFLLWEGEGTDFGASS